MALERSGTWDRVPVLPVENFALCAKASSSCLWRGHWFGTSPFIWAAHPERKREAVLSGRGGLGVKSRAQSARCQTATRAQVYTISAACSFCGIGVQDVAAGLPIGRNHVELLFFVRQALSVCGGTIKEMQGINRREHERILRERNKSIDTDIHRQSSGTMSLRVSKL